MAISIGESTASCWILSTVSIMKCTTVRSSRRIEGGWLIWECKHLPAYAEADCSSLMFLPSGKISEPQKPNPLLKSLEKARVVFDAASRREVKHSALWVWWYKVVKFTQYENRMMEWRNDMSENARKTNMRQFVPICMHKSIRFLSIVSATEVVYKCDEPR